MIINQIRKLHLIFSDKIIVETLLLEGIIQGIRPDDLVLRSASDFLFLTSPGSSKEAGSFRSL